MSVYPFVECGLGWLTLERAAVVCPAASTAHRLAT